MEITFVGCRKNEYFASLWRKRGLLCRFRIVDAPCIRLEWDPDTRGPGLLRAKLMVFLPFFVQMRWLEVGVLTIIASLAISRIRAVGLFSLISKIYLQVF
jgi:hypothetical protein